MQEPELSPATDNHLKSAHLVLVLVDIKEGVLPALGIGCRRRPGARPWLPASARRSALAARVGQALGLGCPRRQRRIQRSHIDNQTPALRPLFGREQ